MARRTPLSALWSSLVDILRRWFGVRTTRALPAPAHALAEPGSAEFLDFLRGEAVVNDPRSDTWIAHLRAELPFPQPLYGAAEPPANVRELTERLTALDREIASQIEHALTDEVAGASEPDWFITLADRFLPLASWYAGVGLDSSAPELPERLRDLAERARRVPGINRALDWLVDQVELLTRQNASFQGAYFALLKVHFEALVRPLTKSPDGVAEVTFEFPSPGARVAELVPPPAPGSATSGTVTRVLCPAVSVKLARAGEDGVRELAWSRGAHVRGR